MVYEKRHQHHLSDRVYFCCVFNWTVAVNNKADRFDVVFALLVLAGILLIAKVIT